jgi:hypothetical protein
MRPENYTAKKRPYEPLVTPECISIFKKYIEERNLACEGLNLAIDGDRYQFYQATGGKPYLLVRRKINVESLASLKNIRPIVRSRSRNSIIHSGKLLVFQQTLENSNNYMDSVVFSKHSCRQTECCQMTLNI